jgi:FkbM family methyltransferase
MLFDAQQQAGFRILLCNALGGTARQLPAFKGKCRMGRILARLMLGRGEGARIPITLRDGSRMSLDPRSRTEGTAFYNGAYDDDDIAFFKTCVSPDGVMLDIGANVGLITIPLGRYLLPGGRLIAFEPVGANACALRENVTLNDLAGVVEVREHALGQSDGTLRMGREVGTGAGTGNAFAEASASGLAQPLDWTIVPLHRLDDVLPSGAVDRLDFIKMDVEGAELDVLRGARQTIERFRPIVYGEFQLTLRDASAGTFADVADILEGLDYQPLAFVDRLRLVPVKYESGRGNAVLCPRERLDGLLARCAQARSNGVKSGLIAD